MSSNLIGEWSSETDLDVYGCWEAFRLWVMRSGEMLRLKTQMWRKTIVKWCAEAGAMAKLHFQRLPTYLSTYLILHAVSLLEKRRVGAWKTESNTRLSMLLVLQIQPTAEDICEWSKVWLNFSLFVRVLYLRSITTEQRALKLAFDLSTSSIV